MRVKMQARELSAGDFGVSATDNSSWKSESVNIGSLQRIADACELMARNHADLVKERDTAVAIASRRQSMIDARDRQIASLKGVITRMKKRGVPDAD